MYWSQTCLVLKPSSIIYSLGQFLNLSMLHSHLLIHNENKKGAYHMGLF